MRQRGLEQFQRDAVLHARGPDGFRAFRRHCRLICEDAVAAGIVIPETDGRETCLDKLTKILANAAKNRTKQLCGSMCSAGIWLVNMCYDPVARMRAIIKSLYLAKPDTEKKQPHYWDATPLLHYVWRVNLLPFVGTNDFFDRTLILCMFFSGLRFTELARMVWSKATKHRHHYEFVLQIKKKAELLSVCFWQLPESMSAICPFRAIEKLALARVSPPVDSIWMRRGDKEEPDGRAISYRVARELKKAGIQTRRPYSVKKALVEYLKHAGASATSTARFLRHALPYTHDKRYARDDKGKKCTARLARHFLRSVAEKKVCIWFWYSLNYTI
jgi:integrase